jgi:hypothetical protein
LKKILEILKFKYKDTRSFWIIDNNSNVCNFVKNKNISSIQSFDFENLFTNIPISELLDVVLNLFDEVEEEMQLERNYFLDLCKFCFFNNYIYTGSDFYLQINGIGMGTSYSSTAANLFLFFYESNYTACNSFRFFPFRYIDDILIFNFDSDFNDTAINIYPNSLVLKKSSNLHLDGFLDFLDLHFYFQENNLFCTLFDKRNSFNFPVVALTNWQSNINKKIFMNIIISQIYRFLSICNNDSDLSKVIYKFQAKLFYDNQFPLNFIKKNSNCFLK